ncbi:hypothetical protein BH20BAC1_BH20BAC1_15110 [soil metagenome]
MNKIFLFNTNSLISAALIPDSISRKALNKAIDLGKIAASDRTQEELIEVLFRKKFDKYFIKDEERLLFIDKIEVHAILFTTEIVITDCRDPKDNKFLELAISSNASCIISGNKDLLALHPFREIPILNATDFINNFL